MSSGLEYKVCGLWLASSVLSPLDDDIAVHTIRRLGLIGCPDDYMNIKLSIAVVGHANHSGDATLLGSMAPAIASNFRTPLQAQ